LIALVGSVFVASLLGSAHCAGMCGGFVCFYAGADARVRPLAHLAYNGGRLLSYATLGALAGVLGAGVEQAGATVGIGRAAGVVAGAMMVLWGVARLLETLRLPLPRLARVPAPALAPLMRAARAWPAELRGLAIGLLSTLLPCGWLYVFAASAAATGSAARGALVMVVFWSGTLPVMAGLGFAAQRLFGPLRSRLPVLTASALVVIGLLTVAGKFHPAHMHTESSVSGHVCP